DAARIPVDRQGRVLVAAAGRELPRGFKSVPFSDILSSIEERKRDALQSLVADRIVLLLVEPAQVKDRVVVQAHLLDRILGQAWLREPPLASTLAGGLVLWAGGGWLWLGPRWGKAAIGTAVLAIGYAVLVVVSASTGLLLPLVIPLAAIGVSSASA